MRFWFSFAVLFDVQGSAEALALEPKGQVSMLNRKNLLPALALAVALAPFAANARTGDVSHNPAAPRNAQAVAQVAAASPGRPGEFNRPTGYILNNTAPEYAATGAPANGSGSL